MMNRSSSAEAFFVPSMMSFVALESSGQKHHAWDWETCSSPNLNTTSSSNNLQGQALYTSAPFLDCQPPPLLPMNGLPFYPAPPPVPAEYPVELIKREVDGVLGCGRIGLNLGHRTYFSGEALNIDRLFPRSRGVYSLSHQPPRCQAEGCRADLSGAKHYHRRHKVCEFHSKATVVVVGGLQQRFCQQCSRFHVLAEFDEAKRSCRKRLADHNRRRRKPQHPAAAAAAVSETSALRNTTTNSSEKTKQAQKNPGDNITSKSTGSTNCTTSTKVNLEGTQQCQIKGNLLRNGPALSLGGLAMEKGGMGPHDMYQAQGHFATVLAREKVSQQQQHSFHLHHNLFCSTSHEALQSTGGGPGHGGASDHHLESRLHLGQAMFEVDYM